MDKINTSLMGLSTTYVSLTADDIAKIAADTHQIARFVGGKAVMEETTNVQNED
jgi:hypothetical protein